MKKENACHVITKQAVQTPHRSPMQQAPSGRCICTGRPVCPICSFKSTQIPNAAGLPRTFYFQNYYSFFCGYEIGTGTNHQTMFTAVARTLLIPIPTEVPSALHVQHCYNFSFECDQRVGLLYDMWRCMITWLYQRCQTNCFVRSKSKQTLPIRNPVAQIQEAPSETQAKHHATGPCTWLLCLPPIRQEVLRV